VDIGFSFAIENEPFRIAIIAHDEAAAPEPIIRDPALFAALRWLEIPLVYRISGEPALQSSRTGPSQVAGPTETTMPTNAPPPAESTLEPHASATTYSLVTEPDQGLTEMYSLIASATTSIDMTMYELTDVTVMDAFAKAAKAGVAVRVILDQSGDEKKVNTPAYNYLEENKCGVHWANPAYAVTHQKTITVDAATSAIMTLNLTPTDYKTTRDFAVITNNAADIDAIETTFNADYTNAQITPPTGENLVWSPTNASSALLALIDGATKSLLISQEEFGDEKFVAAVVAALQRGVAVSLVQENMNNQYSDTLTTMKTAGAKIATYSSQTGRYIHAKTVLADFGTPDAKLFVGSENFTTDSLADNRELGLIFSDANCMAGVSTALTADFNGGTPF
jgi:phosphatidylserine/phosphatidylglycerophosphate/cardiolipin synthase-like enzyme